MSDRILIVEDEPIVAMDLEATLLRLGYEVCGTVADGLEAVALATEQAPSAVLMDIGLGAGIDGIEAAQQIRKKADVPVIFVTANGDEATLQRAKQAGPFGYVLKPFQERELRITIETALHQHRLERELKASKRWFETTLHSIGDAVIATDGFGQVRLINKVGERLTGWTQAEAEGRPLVDVFPIFQRGTETPAINPVTRVLETGSIVGLANHTFLRSRSGREIQIDDAAAPIMDERGVINGVVLTFRDVDERYHAEERLRAAEERYRGLFEHTADGLVVLDDDGTIEEVNAAFEQLFGWMSEELVGQKLATLVLSPEQGPSRLGAYLRGELSPELGLSLELTGVHRDGRFLSLHLRVGQVWIEGKRRYTGVIRDVSSQKEVEARTLLAQKMDGIGRLAGGVAHDFNNLLTAIISYGSLLHEELAPTDNHREDVAQILAAAERAGGLTKQLLAFARRQIVEPRIVDVSELLRSAEPAMRQSLRADIQYTAEIIGSLPSIRVDPSQIERVLLNLALNARDSMPQGGRLRLEVSSVDLTSAQAAALPDVPAGRCVVLKLSDSGHGMPATVLERVFEPFFTTREGRGSGLGLATCYGIVKQSGGHLTVESAVGKGTTFTIYLPGDDAEADPSRPTPSSESARGLETVLLCEDNPMVRRVTARALRSFGYRVIEAESGAAALLIAEAERAEIPLLLTDVVMPGMSGPELAEAIRKSRSQIKVLFMSGYTDAAIVEGGELRAGVEFIAKPFTPASLGAKVRQVLGTSK